MGNIGSHLDLTSVVARTSSGTPENAAILRKPWDEGISRLLFEFQSGPRTGHPQAMSPFSWSESYRK
jgi:hypothetical protein